MENTACIIHNIIQNLFPFDYSVCTDEDVNYLDKYLSYLPFEISRFSSGEELNGWVIPRGWRCRKAELFVNGELIFDGVQTKLGCSYLSPSFKGRISKKELIDHSAYRNDLPGAVVYDWTRLYRSKDVTWGLSVPWSILKTIPDDAKCDVIIESEFYEYSMPVLSFLLPGELKSEVLINAHNCHPYQANDDLSGCAVGIQMFKDLINHKNRLYSYRLLIAPELYGPMFWLRDNPDVKENIVSCILLKSVGNKSNIKMQHSFLGNTYIDSAVKLALEHNVKNNYTLHSFRSYYGNDEIVFESPGLRIPSITLTRYPFNEYHTSYDDPSIIDLDSLKETYDILKDSLQIFESNLSLHSPPPGLFCLSNPKYDLYRKAIEPGISDEGTTLYEKQWNLLMNCLPMHISQGVLASELALRYNINYFELIDYLKQWLEKNLAKSTPYVATKNAQH